MSPFPYQEDHPFFAESAALAVLHAGNMRGFRNSDVDLDQQMARCLAKQAGSEKMYVTPEKFVYC